jgi:hypothetical protein
MAEVKSFPGVSRPDQELCAQPQPEVIAYLEDLLAKAQAGTIQALAFSYVRLNGRPSYGWTGIKSGDIRMFALHSGMLTAVTAMGVELDQGSSESVADDPNEV